MATSGMTEAALRAFLAKSDEGIKPAMEAALTAALAAASVPNEARDLMIEWAEVNRWEGGDACAEAAEEIDLLLDKLRDADFVIIKRS